MNASNAKHYLPLVQALSEGKAIQMMEAFGKWKDVDEVYLNTPASNYRIKPEPREIWYNRWPNGQEDGPWRSSAAAVIAASNIGYGAVQVCYREVI